MLNVIINRIQAHIDGEAEELTINDPISNRSEAIIRGVANRMEKGAKVREADDEDLLCGNLIKRVHINGDEYSFLLVDPNDNQTFYYNIAVWCHTSYQEDYEAIKQELSME